MPEIPILVSHLPLVAKHQHIGEHLAAERTRLETELRYVMGQAQRVDAELTHFLQSAYGLDVPVTVDSERGVLVTPDDPPAPPQTPTEPQEGD
jgi:hypothetical protein